MSFWGKLRAFLGCEDGDPEEAERLVHGMDRRDLLKAGLVGIALATLPAPPVRVFVPKLVVPDPPKLVTGGSALECFNEFIKAAGPAYATSPHDVINEAVRQTYAFGRLVG